MALETGLPPAAGGKKQMKRVCDGETAEKTPSLGSLFIPPSLISVQHPSLSFSHCCAWISLKQKPDFVITTR